MTTPEEPNDNNPVVSLVAVKTKKEQEKVGPTNNELLTQGIEAFTNSTKNASGFFALIFDASGDPKIIWAGDFSMLTAVGALEFAKSEFIQGGLYSTDASNE